MRSYNDQLDNYGFLTWREDEKGGETTLVEGDSRKSGRKCGKTTKPDMKDGDKLSTTTGKYSWWKSLFRRSTSSPVPSPSQKQIQRHLSDQDIASDVSVRRRQRKNKLRSSSRKCRSVLLDEERLKLNEIDLEGYGDYCTIDLSSKAKKESPIPAENSGEQDNCGSITVKDKLYPELLPVEVDNTGGSVKHETASPKTVDKVEDKLKVKEKEEERSRNGEINSSTKRKVRFDFRRSFSLNRKKVSKPSSKRVTTDPVNHKQPEGGSPISTTLTDHEKANIKADESWNNKYPCENRSRSQRKVLVHIHTKEEITVENGVPQWGDRPQKFDEGIRINGVLVLTEASRSPEDTEDDDEGINKEVNVTDSLKRNLLPPSGLTVVAEIHTPEDKSLTKRRSMTLPKPTIIGARKESLHRSIKDENGSLRKLNLLQFERSTQNEQETSSKFGRFFAITGITTTTDYEFLEYTNRKNKRRELKIKYPEITSTPIKSMAHCLRQASKYKKPSLAKPPRQHKPKSSKPLPSSNQSQAEKKEQRGIIHHKKSHTSHLLPECLNGSRRWYSESDLSSMCVTPLKLSGKVFDQEPEKENSEPRVGDQQHRMKSDKFLRRIRSRLERIEKLKNIADTSKASSLQDLSSCTSTPRREPAVNKLQTTDRFKKIINTRLNSTTTTTQSPKTTTKQHNQLPTIYKPAGSTQTLLRRSHSIRPKFETDLDEMLKYSSKSSIEEQRHGAFSVVSDGNRPQMSNSFEFLPLHKPHESPFTIPSNGSPACSLDSYDDLLPSAPKSVQTSISGHSCSSSYTGNDPIMNTMLDAMRKISVKYSSRDCLLNQSSSCASSTSNEDTRSSVVPPLRLRHQAVRNSQHRPHSSYDSYTKYRQQQPRRLVEAAPQKSVGQRRVDQHQLELADVRNFMHWDCDETDL